MKYIEQRTITVTAYPFKLMKSRVEMFCKFADQYIKGGKNGIKKGDINLTKSTEITCFHYLEYFDLITQYGGGKGAEWHLTTLGRNFYYGQEAVLNMVAQMDKQILPQSHICWESHHERPRAVYIWEILRQTQTEWEDFTHFKKIRKESIQNPLF